MFERNKLKKAAIINKSEAHWAEYKIARNNVNANISRPKMSYYKKYFKTNLGDIKKSRRGVNLISGRNLPATERSRIDVGDQTCTFTIGISNALNFYFAHIGPGLANNIPNLVTVSKITLCHPITALRWGRLTEVLYNSLQENKSTGLDGISARLLKEAGPVIVSSLTHIINLSIRSGYFRDEWKISEALPV